MEGVQLKHSPRFSRPVGWGAGIVALSVGIATLLGAGWGLTRPGYTATVEGDRARVDPLVSPDNVEFISFAGFTVLTALLGLVIGLVAYVSAQRRASVGRMVFVAAVAAFASWSFYTFGTWTAQWHSGVPDPHGLSEGETLTFVPLLRPGPAWLAAPFVAALAYWVGLAFSVGCDPVPRSSEYDERHAHCD